jgi:alpha-2-macroglobulin
MKILPIFLVVFLSATLLQSQDSSVTLIYRITDGEAERLYSDSRVGEVAENFFHTLVDTFSRTGYNKKLDYGHYLFVKADWEALIVDLKSFYSFSALDAYNGRDLALQIVDSTGQALGDVKMAFRGKPVPFDEPTGAFRLRNLKKSGILTVQAGGETAFFEVDSSERPRLLQKRYRRFASSRTGRIVLLPVRAGEGIVQFFIDGFGYGHWDWPFRGLFPSKGNELQGYVALDKPRYRPGDTVRIKAYVARPNGKPWKNTVELALSQDRYGYPAIFKEKLKPVSKGAFVYEFVPGDSLRLDSYYTLSFDPPKKFKYNPLTHRFYYEDYQLSEATYRLESAQKDYRRGEKAVLLAEGLDRNGLTIPDGQMKLIVKTVEALEYFEDEVLVPDTLWVYETELQSRGETQIILPDSILPPAGLRIEARAFFVDASGEMHQKELTLDVNLQPAAIDMRLEDGFLVAEYRRSGQVLEKEARLIADLGNSRPEIAVQLPLRLPLNPNARSYRVEAGDATGMIFLREGREGAGPGLVFSGVHHGDSVEIRLYNPHRIPVIWQIFTKNGEADRGSFQEESRQWRRASQGSAPYFLKYQYIWGGKVYDKEEQIIPYKKLIHLEIEGPERVRPGQTVQMALQARDYRGREARGVNIAAGAVNAQFGSLDNIRSPKIRYRRAREPLNFGNFRLRALKKKSFRQPLDRRWYERLDLEKELFYRLRFSRQGIYAEYDTITVDSFYRGVAQIAPYIIRNGKAAPVYLVYCNRKLVYYYGVDDDPPYSFVGRERKNSIAVRTRDFEYLLEDVELKKGRKLEIAIDEDRFLESPAPFRISRRPLPNQLTEREKELLRTSIFFLRNTESSRRQYLWTSHADIRVIGENKGRGPLSIGPFQANSLLKYQVRGGFNAEFKFEPGFEYVLEKDRDRLYSKNAFPSKKDISLPARLPLQRPGRYIYPPSVIEKESFRPPQIKFQEQERKNIPRTGKYAFKFQYDPDEDKSLQAVVLEDENALVRVFRPGERRINNLVPGNYTIFLLTNSGNFATRNFTIRPDTLLFQDLSGDPLTPDSNRVILQKIFPTQNLRNEDIQKLSKESRTPSVPEDWIFVTGRVTDDDGEPLIGASVLVKGTSTGTVTDIDGYFGMWAPRENSTLTLSYTGYNVMEVDRNANSDPVDAILEPGIALLESVVMGYSRKYRSNGFLHEISGRVFGNVSVSEEKDSENLTFDPEAEIGETSGLRVNFRDYAFWQPNIVTDKEGKAFFTVTYPDDITGWRTFAVGMDEKGKGGLASGYTRSFLELAGRLSVPGFLIEGDRAEVVGRAVNYTRDTFEIATHFRIEDRTLENNRHRLVGIVVEKAAIDAPQDADSIRLSYALEYGNYFDGEERSIPVFPQGTVETSGRFLLLEKDTTLELHFEENLGEVAIFAQSNLLEAMLSDIDYLKEYPYGCNEQTASRLLAFLMEKDIRNQLGEPFDHEEDIVKMIQLLKKNQNTDGSWGWWPGGSSDLWMTTYVLRALRQAGLAGYRTAASEDGLRFVSGRLQGLRRGDLLDALELLSEAGQNLDYAALLAPFDSLELSLVERLLIIKIRQANGLDFSLDSIYHKRKTTIFGAHYWGEEGYAWGENAVPVTLLVYEILKKAGKEDELKPLRQYFLERRNEMMPGRLPGWRNTFETAQILKTLLPDWISAAGAAGREGLQSRLRLSGSLDAEVVAFPFKAGFSPGPSLVIDKTGALPLYLTAFQRFQNRAPLPKNEPFSISSRLEQDGKETMFLEKGKKAVLVVEIEAGSSADYVSIEAPIPAGCSYFTKPNMRKYPESYREHFRQHVAIFCERLPQGKHTFTIELEPRFSGTYTLNPARAEQMYFPVFYGRNEGKVVEIAD